MTLPDDSIRYRRFPPQRVDRTRWPRSPCISVCTLDDDNNCLGCGRTREQISRWTLMSKNEQWDVIEWLSPGEETS